MAPVSVLFFLLATPLVRILFERGEFNLYSTEITSSAFLFSALGLWCYGALRVLVTAFHALQDTATPVKVASMCLGINLVLNFLLMIPLKVGGIALASSIAVLVNFSMLFFLMNKKIGGLSEGMLNYLGRLGIAALIMGAVILGGWKCFSMKNEIVKILTVSLTSGIVFVVFAFLLKIEGMVKIVQEAKRFLK